jgi:dUTP pyrophosphatase
MQIQVKRVESLTLPKRAREGDSGYDVVAMSDPKIIGDSFNINGRILWNRIDYIEYDTNLFVAPESKVHILAFPRSSISNYNLMLKNSVMIVDNNYRGSIKFRFCYIIQPNDLIIVPSNGKIVAEVNYEGIYKKGDRCGQLLIEKVNDAEFELVDKLSETERMDGGFGSSGL